MAFTESELEEAVLEWFRGLGYDYISGLDIAPDGVSPERKSYRDIFLTDRLERSLKVINPRIPDSAITDALTKLKAVASPSLIDSNYAFHRMLVEGVDVEYKRKDGTIAGDKVYLIDFNEIGNNEFLVVNQYTVHEGDRNRRPDVVVFINGLPIAVLELKNPADEKATIWSAFNQLQTYKKEIPSLFHFNELLVISDGLEARYGTISSNRERFMWWRTMDGEVLAPKSTPQVEVLLHGVFEKRNLLDLLLSFIVFEDNEKGTKIKKVAGYHQFHAVRKSVETTAAAISPEGSRQIGVVWHTQGSGKSLTMVFYAGRIIQDSRTMNPTIVVITDRNDLDDQLYGTFCSCHDLLRQRPVQAESREHLQKLLNVASGGVVFTTIQKFFPEKSEVHLPALSDRRNIVVIADEAHRSQYDFIDGFARHMRDALPNASFIGFTGTPLELEDKSTRAVFGDYISVYDIQRAVEDGATVPIYYEGRLAKIALNENEKPHVDDDFEDATEGEEQFEKDKLKTKWAAIEALVGTDKRLKLVAQDLVAHYDKRQAAMEGKAMIVCMSRRICVDLYNEIIKLRPEWHDEDDAKGALKIVMTGSASDPTEWSQHIRNKSRREVLANRFKDPADPFKIVIVRDMWLTGFDAPCLHTMYLDKPMKGHNLMQAIARVNRVFRDKPGGLVVDYLGLADQLRKAMATYTQSGGKGKATIDQAEAVAVMLEKYEICCDIMHGFDYSAWQNGTAVQRTRLIANGMEHVLGLDKGKERFSRAVTELSQAFALASANDEAKTIRDDVGYFQAVKASISKGTGGGTPKDELDLAIRQIVQGAIISDQIIDIFDAVGLKKPDISILSEEFLAEVRKIPQRNLAVELLNRLLKDETKRMRKSNATQSKAFSAMLAEAITKYEQRAVTTAQVIELLIEMAKKMKEAQERGEKLGLNEAELAFYDALETNDSAVKVLGDEVLRGIAKDITDTINKNISIDWSVRESAKANMRRMVKRVLRRYDYPPDKQDVATRNIIEQAELLCGEMST
jgi:type I restriction enzyme R subunit